MSKGILPSIFGGSTLNAIDRVLGIPTQTVTVPQPVDPSQGGLMGLGLPTALFTPQAGVVQSPNNTPFVETIIPFSTLGSPLAKGYNPTHTNKPPYVVNLPGEAIVYKQSGSPPNARLTVDLGGRLYTIQPGMRLVAPFQNFSIVKRNFLITDDFNNAVTIPTAVPSFGFSGEAHFIIEKQANISYNDAANSSVNPWFRPTFPIGSLAPDNSAGTPDVAQVYQAMAVGPSGAKVFGHSGCQKLRLYTTCNVTGGAQATDKIQFHLAELYQVYDTDSLYYNADATDPPVAAWYAAQSLSGNLKYETPVFTVPAADSGATGQGSPIVMFDFDIRDCPGGFVLWYSNSNSNPALVILTGVP